MNPTSGRSSPQSEPQAQKLDVGLPDFQISSFRLEMNRLHLTARRKLNLDALPLFDTKSGFLHRIGVYPSRTELGTIDLLTTRRGK
jgi:hypothetical protein